MNRKGWFGLSMIALGLATGGATTGYILHENAELHSQYSIPDVREAERLETQMHKVSSVSYILNNTNNYDSIRQDLEGKMAEYALLESRYNAIMSNPEVRNNRNALRNEQANLIGSSIGLGAFVSLMFIGIGAVEMTGNKGKKIENKKENHFLSSKI